MKLEFLMQFDSHVSEIQEIGDTPQGKRLVYAVKDGTFEGPRLKGKVRDGAAGDWMMIVRNGLATLDVRKTFETDDGALILVKYQGLYQFKNEVSEELSRGNGYDFGDTLFQVQMQFETGDDRYDWLNNTLAVAEGRETGQKVEYKAWALSSEHP